LNKKNRLKANDFQKLKSKIKKIK